MALIVTGKILSSTEIKFERAESESSLLLKNNLKEIQLRVATVYS